LVDINILNLLLPITDADADSLASLKPRLRDTAMHIQRPDMEMGMAHN